MQLRKCIIRVTSISLPVQPSDIFVISFSPLVQDHLLRLVVFLISFAVQQFLKTLHHFVKYDEYWSLTAQNVPQFGFPSGLDSG